MTRTRKSRGTVFVSFSRRRRVYATELAGRDGTQCVWCGAAVTEPSGRSFDHLVPRARGGLWHVDNLVLACPGCNHTRSMLPVHERMRGLEQEGGTPQGDLLDQAVTRAVASRAPAVAVAMLLDVCLGLGPDRVPCQLLANWRQPLAPEMVIRAFAAMTEETDLLFEELERQAVLLRQQPRKDVARRAFQEVTSPLERHILFQVLDGKHAPARELRMRQRQLALLDVFEDRIHSLKDAQRARQRAAAGELLQPAVAR